MEVVDLSLISFIYFDILENDKAVYALTGRFISSIAVSEARQLLSGEVTTMPCVFELKFRDEDRDFYVGVTRFVKDLKELKTLKDAGKELEKYCEELCARYFRLLVKVLEIEEKSIGTTDFAGNMRFLREFYFIGCRHDVMRNQYLVPYNHPIMMVHKLAEIDGRDQIDKFSAWTERKQFPHWEKLVETIFENKMMRDKHFMLYSEDEVYQISPMGNSEERGFEIARLFQSADSYVKIQGVRLIEKVDRYILNNKDKLTRTIKIVVLGRIENAQLLIDYYKQDNVRIEITYMRREASAGEYIYIVKGQNGLSRRSAYNLLNEADITALYSDYDIILFLSDNSNYRQRQRPKKSEEIWASSRAIWYVQTMAEAYKKFKDKAACYNRCFDRVGVSINSQNDYLTATLQFDERLFMKLVNAPHPQSDVYLYIKYGNEIGRMDLSTQNVCKDEFYNGYEIMVYSAYKESNEINAAIRNFLDETKEPKYCIYINMWKIIKSLRDDYWKTFSEDMGLLNAEGVFIIKELRRIYFYVDYSEIVKDSACNVIKFGLVDCPEQYYEIISSFIGTILKLGLQYTEKKIMDRVNANGESEEDDTPDLSCVHNCLRSLLVNSIISKANSIEDILMAYYISIHRYKRFVVVEGNALKNQREINNNSSGFPVQRLIYSIITKIDQLALRPIDDLAAYFTNEYRKEINMDIDEDNFLRIMKHIRKACNILNFEGSNLFDYSKAIEFE